MSAPINIVFQIANLPEGWQGTPQDLVTMIAAGLTGYANGNFLTGQIGGPLPTSDIGLYVDPVTLTVKIWSPDANQYVNQSNLPVGVIAMWPGAVTPTDTDWIIMQGQTLLRTDYPALYAVVGDVYGAADSTHFVLPDLRGRSPVGVGQGDYPAPRTDSIAQRTLGDKIGYEWPLAVDPVAGQSLTNRIFFSQLTPPGAYTDATPPGLVINWIIKAK